MNWRPVPTRLLIAASALIAAGAQAACGSEGSPAPTSPPPPAPKPTTAQPRDAGRLLDGGVPAFKARLAALRGTPVVVNQWASWCGPCRFEFPFFTRLARKHQGRVAFLGVDSQDTRAGGERFLRDFRTPFPHFFDPSTAIARSFKGAFAWPTTAFYDARGSRTYTHAGAYASQGALERDIRRYALR
jgi:thiol-disulfide isomerase/thioredoxin